MVTTEEIIALAEEKSSKIGKQNISKQRAAEARKKIGIGVKTKVQTARTAIWNRIKGFAKKKKESFKTKYKKSQRTTKRVKGVMPPQLKAYSLKKKAMNIANKRVQQSPMIKRMPTSVRELQNARSIRNLLTAEEQQVVDRLHPSARKAAAIQMATRRMKDQQVSRERALPRTIVSKDIMTGRDIVRRQVPIERWMR